MRHETVFHKCISSWVERRREEVGKKGREGKGEEWGREGERKKRGRRDVRSLVPNPPQNRNAMPNTIPNCSSTRRNLRTSGEEGRRKREERREKETYLCTPLSGGTNVTIRLQRIGIVGKVGGNTPHAAIIACPRENLSVYTPSATAPNNAPSSNIAATPKGGRVGFETCDARGTVRVDVVPVLLDCFGAGEDEVYVSGFEFGFGGGRREGRDRSSRQEQVEVNDDR
ncbi:hypothetical protein BDQ17DRAFT_1326708 [Cyathus striatus]|nr:hypothetical protein BDQ17DRAFT_1326708 [Cyathus striatus]